MPRVAFFTLGCKVNQYESFSLMSAFSDAGFTIVEPAEQADVYIVNSCTVTASGDKKSLQVLRRFRRKAPGAFIVLCGCFPQAFPEKAAAIPEADLVMGSKNRTGILDAAINFLSGKNESNRVAIAPHAPGEPFEAMRLPSFLSRTRAFLKIQDGCERRCSYCIIPDARGPIRSKPVDKLISELDSLSKAGYREVVLVGINLGCYGLDLGLSLTDAIRAACQTPGILRVRLGSLEPELLTADTIREWARMEKLCPQFHLSLQSGCDVTLTRMRRQYTSSEYRVMADTLRKEFPGCALTTDVMVAFPGETEQDHQENETFVQQMLFARTHTFVYSPRPGTPAAEYQGQVDAEEASGRASRMAEIARKSASVYMEALLGSEQQVLFETKKGGFWQGHAPNYILVRAKSDIDLSGKILPVVITKVLDDACEGKLAD